jgi:pyruvate formate lyase activating enzyme
MNELPTHGDPFTVPTRYWHRLDDGRIQCDVCPRTCRLHEGQRELCFLSGPESTTRSCSRPTAGRAGSAST